MVRDSSSLSVQKLTSPPRWLAVAQSGLINSFPFDPAGMNSSDMAVKEVKNGRLAMVRTGGGSDSRR